MLALALCEWLGPSCSGDRDRLLLLHLLLHHWRDSGDCSHGVCLSFELDHIPWFYSMTIRWEYFNSVWNIMDIIVIVVSLCTNGNHSLYKQNIQQRLEWFSLDFISAMQIYANHVIHGLLKVKWKKSSSSPNLYKEICGRRPWISYRSKHIIIIFIYGCTIKLSNFLIFH